MIRHVILFNTVVHSALINGNCHVRFKGIDNCFFINALQLSSRNPQTTTWNIDYRFSKLIFLVF